MNVHGAFTATPSPKDLMDALRISLTESALPGEADGLASDDLDRIVAFVAGTAAHREPDEPAVSELSPGLTVNGQRRMRLAVVNDDMPFLVDSVAQTIAAHGLDISRLLHPVVSVRRSKTGNLTTILPSESGGARRESIIYMEIDRADARARRQLRADILATLSDVYAAVDDWPHMRKALRADAVRLPDGEGVALLRWLLDRNFTQIGHQVESQDGGISQPLGILRSDDSPLWSDQERDAAFACFAGGHEAPLMVKSSRNATVHRRVPLDLVIVPVRKEGRIEALSIHAGLWTSEALKAPVEQIPVLRSRLAAIEEKFGFDPRGHAGKSLRHALGTLPPDLLIGFDPETIERLALTAMSLTNHPRPKLVLVQSALRRQLFAFIWLSREELSTARRTLLGDMIGRAAKAPLTGWSMELGDGGLALLRFAFDLAGEGKFPDEAKLDREIEEMLRGWEPAVEAGLARDLTATRATRLAIAWASSFPQSYRERYYPREAARDILRLSTISGPDERQVRLYRAPTDRPETLRLKIYRLNGLVMLSDAVPVLENFGFSALKEVPTHLSGNVEAQIYEFMVCVESGAIANRLLARSEITEKALTEVLEGRAENDAFNQLLTAAELSPEEVVLFRAWFRYMRQTGFSYSIQTVVDALKHAPKAARGIIAMFNAMHDPARRDDKTIGAADEAIDNALADVSALDEDRILRWFRSLVQATLRTNAFSAAGREALAFKIDSSLVPGLPAPVPWREIWVCSQRVEGIHLRGGPVARGGIRWSDRRDDFRTEILGLMKAQVVKNAVIVPTGAKGGFYPKRLPPASDREAWLAEGTESYRLFIRALLSLTDNIVESAIVHPKGIVIRDDGDPYFVVAADKGTATFSDIANEIATDHGFWLGDAFASGGSHGYDHKAMAITARGAWISVQRHFAEIGVDIQSEPVRVAGCGDMSGDVFGNGMLQSRVIKLVAAFDHRHIFLDPDPDPAKSWEERKRLFDLPRSSWADYDKALISKGGGVFPRTQKAISLTPEVKELLGVSEDSLDPSALISAILKSQVDLLWFGGIGTYVKSHAETNAEVGDPANDAHRVDGRQLRTKVVGEGANLGLTQAGRITFATIGGRINTDFIDNSAGVDCSDNEVNIKILLNREMIEGRLDFDTRNTLLKDMTDAVAELVLTDNRLQTLALSLSERGAAEALSSHIRIIEILETKGQLIRSVEGLAANDVLNRRAQDGRGLTRPELAVLLSHAKLAIQGAIEQGKLSDDALLAPLLREAFPPQLRERFGPAIERHRLRNEIIATKLANRIVNRLGFVIPFELADEEGVEIVEIASAYVAVDAIFDVQGLWDAIEAASVDENGRLELMSAAGITVRRQIADMIRVRADDSVPSEIVGMLRPGIEKLDIALPTLLRREARTSSSALRSRLAQTGADDALIDRIVRLQELDGVIGNAMLAKHASMDEIAATRAYVRLGEALGLDWARSAADRFTPSDGWERLLTAGLRRDFEQLRLDFLERHSAKDPVAEVDKWLARHAASVAQFRMLVERAQTSATPSAAMLAQISSQAQTLLGH